MFQGAEIKSRRFTEHYACVAQERGCAFLDDVGICTPLPGTRLWRQLCTDQAGRLEYQGFEATQLHVVPVFNHCYCDVPGPELEKGVRRLYRRFYLRSEYLWKRAKVTHSIQGWRDTAQAGLGVLKFMLLGSP